MLQIRLPRLALLVCTLLFSARPLCVQAHELQPLITLDTAGYGIGAAYSLKTQDEVEFGATVGGTRTNGSGSYTLTGANGANPVQLNLAFTEHIHLGALNLQYNHYLKKQKPFYISGGLVLSLLRADADTIPTDSSLVFGGNLYSAAQLGTLGIHARWNVVTPYLGVGWAAKNANGSQRGPRFEVGAYDIGRARISFSPHGVVAVNPAIFNPYLDSLRGKLENDLSGITVYPVLRVSFPVGGPSR